jgi:hypothetical protein
MLGFGLIMITFGQRADHVEFSFAEKAKEAWATLEQRIYGKNSINFLGQGRGSIVLRDVST